MFTLSRHSFTGTAVFVLLPLFRHPSSCSPHGRDSQEMPALKQQACLSTQRTAESTGGAVLPGQTARAFPFLNCKVRGFCTSGLAHTGFCSNMDSKTSYFVLKSFGNTSKATSQSSPSQLSVSLWKGSQSELKNRL